MYNYLVIDRKIGPAPMMMVLTDGNNPLIWRGTIVRMYIKHANGGVDTKYFIGRRRAWPSSTVSPFSLPNCEVVAHARGKRLIHCLLGGLHIKNIS